MAGVGDIASYLINSPARVASLNLQMMGALGHYVFGRKRIDLFIASFDRGLLHRWWSQDGGWHGKWEPRGGEWASRASVVTSGDGRLYVFGLALNGDLQWTGRQGDTDAPGDWHIGQLGHPDGDRLISHPTAAFDGGVVRVFARAESGALWTIYLNTELPINSGWQRLSEQGMPDWPSGWMPTFAPAAVVPELGRVDLFAARSTIARLYHAWREVDGASGGWEALRTASGGIVARSQELTSGPDAVAWPKTDEHPLGVMHISACGQPNPLVGPTFVINSWLGRHWGGQAMFVEDAVSSSALASWGYSRLDLFYVAVVPGGNYYSGPWRAVHLSSNDRVHWSTDNTSLGAYPVQYFPGG